ncbi:uncharacterized protein UTRI_02429 [Ustilago trichophora]|uniref:Uncharacterized protein n=1 Tax=Ustilago trichophora TaxID=86804 RepID=A0A5C3E631_9BASI|nr:uncharacterized protein UTRI_02429 [Ustilago trichophora]
MRASAFQVYLPSLQDAHMLFGLYKGAQGCHAARRFALRHPIGDEWNATSATSSYVPLSEYGESHMLQDYLFLSSISRTASETGRRIMSLNLLPLLLPTPPIPLIQAQRNAPGNVKQTHQQRQREQLIKQLHYRRFRVMVLRKVWRVAKPMRAKRFGQGKRVFNLSGGKGEKVGLYRWIPLPDPDCQSRSHRRIRAKRWMDSTAQFAQGMGSDRAGLFGEVDKREYDKVSGLVDEEERLGGCESGMAELQRKLRRGGGEIRAEGRYGEDGEVMFSGMEEVMERWKRVLHQKVLHRRQQNNGSRTPPPPPPPPAEAPSQTRQLRHHRKHRLQFLTQQAKRQAGTHQPAIPTPTSLLTTSSINILSITLSTVLLTIYPAANQIQTAPAHPSASTHQRPNQIHPLQEDQQQQRQHRSKSTSSILRPQRWHGCCKVYQRDIAL